ncbi:MAG: type II secretion system protein M [Candidatus Tectomicrobia bacterium]|nr:type II secretion system protein M [Candidatus Tectomicrobia bacterium]
MNFLQNLQMREKVLVVCAAVAIILALVYALAIGPLLDNSTRLDRQIRKAQQDLETLHAHRRDYLQRQRVLDRINTQIKQRTNFSIFSRLEALALNTGIRDKMLHMKPTASPPSDAYTEESVEIKMEDITLEQLKTYLYEVEQSPQFLKIKRLNIKPRLNNRQLLSVIFRVSTFTPKDQQS